MHVIAGIFGFVLLFVAVVDAFRTVVVARHAHSLPTITRMFHRVTWAPFAMGARFFRSEQRRESYLGIYGPLSLLLLLGLWAGSVIAAFAMLQWSVGLQTDGAPSRIAEEIYFSAGTFFTLGAGTPRNMVSKYLAVIEAGFGFSFLGLVIGYLPVLYQSFSSRELRILLLDARAGSPPSAVQFFLRRGSDSAELRERLADWEEWALDLLQSHLSYPMLAYYRSQHANQSWLSALTTIIDVSTLMMLSANDDLKHQAGFTFAAARHALVHTASIFRLAPQNLQVDRLPSEEFSRLCCAISASQAPPRVDRMAEPELARLRLTYEPYANVLGAYFLMALPPWMPSEPVSDNWQISSWGRGGRLHTIPFLRRDR
jgi:hypothetical protein